MDLLGRKLGMKEGKPSMDLPGEMKATIAAAKEIPGRVSLKAALGTKIFPGFWTAGVGPGKNPKSQIPIPSAITLRVALPNHNTERHYLARCPSKFEIPNKTNAHDFSPGEFALFGKSRLSRRKACEQRLCPKI